MKVLYIAPEYPNINTNAAQVRANQLLTRLSLRVDLHIFGYGLELSALSASKPNFQTIVPRRPLNSFALLTSFFSRNPRAFQRYTHPHAIDAFCQVLDDFRPDIVHFDSIGVLGLMDYVLEVESKPMIVVHSHDSVSRLYESQLRCGNRLLYLDRLLQWKKILRVESESYAKASICLVDSVEDAAYLSNLNRENRVRVLPLGFDEVEYCPEGSKALLECPSLVFSGAMNGVQSVDAALFLVGEVMPLVWKFNPEIHLYLVGGNPHKKLLDIDDGRVHVTGFVDDLASYLRAADVYVCPIRVGSGMRTRIVEALACGCIMVVRPEAVQGLAVEASDSPVWIEALSANDFANSIQKILERKSINEMKQSSVRYVSSKFSWSVVADKLVEVYNDVNRG